MSDFKVGDKVVFLKNYAVPEKECPGYNSGMEALTGKQGVITRKSSYYNNCWKVDNEWIWHERWLKRVKENDK